MHGDGGAVDVISFVEACLEEEANDFRESGPGVAEEGANGHGGFAELGRRVGSDPAEAKDVDAAPEEADDETEGVEGLVVPKVVSSIKSKEG